MLAFGRPLARILKTNSFEAGQNAAPVLLPLFVRRKKMFEVRPPETTPTKVHSPWVGVILSFLISGAGQFLSGRQSRGIKWFIAFHLSSYLFLWLLASSWIPSFMPVMFGIAMFGAWLSMLLDAYRPIVRLTISKWLIFLLVVALVLTLPEVEVRVVSPLLQAFKVPASSMAPTILGASSPESSGTGDHVLVDKSAYRFTRPKVGDIVAIEMLGLSESFPHSTIYLKRIVGVPGDKIEIVGRILHRNGQPVKEDYTQFIDPNSVYEHFGPYVLSQDSYFVMGDNRDNSQDSRLWGPLPKARIIGKVSRIYWPLRRAGSVR